jgi:hypothetical protein
MVRLLMLYSILVRFTGSPAAARMASTCRRTSSSRMYWKERIRLGLSTSWMHSLRILRQ